MLQSVRPLLSDADTDILYVDQQVLLGALRLVVTGTSSALHSWDHTTEKFVLRGVQEGRHSFVVITGKDEVITARYASTSTSNTFLTLSKFHLPILENWHYLSTP